MKQDVSPSILELKYLCHLIQKFNGTLKPGVGPIDTLDALHPTPADPRDRPVSGQRVEVVPTEAAAGERDHEPVPHSYASVDCAPRRDSRRALRGAGTLEQAEARARGVKMCCCDLLLSGIILFL